MRFTNDFEKNEHLGRKALSELKQIYSDIFSGTIEYTPDFCPYDAFYFIYDNEYKIKKRIFIEIKIRNKDYDDLFLEWNKWRDINNIATKQLHLKEDEFEILYINFLPTGTIIWKIKDMKSKDLVVRKMNKATSIDRKNKIDKKVWLLDKSVGKRLNYILNEDRILKQTYDSYLINKVKENIKKKPGLEDVLFN